MFIFADPGKQVYVAVSGAPRQAEVPLPSLAIAHFSGGPSVELQAQGKQMGKYRFFSTCRRLRRFGNYPITAIKFGGATSFVKGAGRPSGLQRGSSPAGLIRSIHRRGRGKGEVSLQELRRQKSSEPHRFRKRRKPLGICGQGGGGGACLEIPRN
jgi:hypothetical protein